MGVTKNTGPIANLNPAVLPEVTFVPTVVSLATLTAKLEQLTQRLDQVADQLEQLASLAGKKK